MAKYTLKKDVLLWCESLHKHFTKDNITDEAAAIMIKERPEYERLFNYTDDIQEAFERFENGDNEKQFDLSKTKTLDKKPFKLKTK